MLQVSQSPRSKRMTSGLGINPQEPTMALNESFLEQFRVNHEDFETLMEDWFYDEEWLKKREKGMFQHGISKFPT
jgi:hypothetical protein